MEITGLMLNVIVILLLLGGIGFTLIGLPGNVLIFLTALGYGYLEGFVHMNYQTLLLLLAALILGELVESFAGAVGAKKEKASFRAIIAAFFGGIIGGIIGTGILPVVGSIGGAILGGFAGSYLAEYTKHQDLDKAGRVAQSVIKAQLIGLVIKFAIAITMIIYILVHLPWREFF